MVVRRRQDRMPQWQQVAQLLPAIGLLTAPLVVLTAWSWLRRSEPSPARWVLTAVTVAAVACSAFWWAWSWP